MAIDVAALTAKREAYVHGLTTVQAQATQARQQWEGLVRQAAVQEGAIAAIDELIGLAQENGTPDPYIVEEEPSMTLAGPG